MQGLCPTGWHLPRVAEVDGLAASLNSSDVGFWQVDGGFKGVYSGYTNNTSSDTPDIFRQGNVGAIHLVEKPTSVLENFLFFSNSEYKIAH